jgi:Protein of unknown function (DUF3108)
LRSRRAPFLPYLPRLIAAVLLALSQLVPASSCSAQEATAADPVQAESFHYRWRLTKLGGLLASLFLPSSGDGLLSTRSTSGTRIESELLITSPESDRGEYWRYGSEIERETGHTLRAWSSYLFRGEVHARATTVPLDGAFDIASGIYLLRRDPPTTGREIEIWSDGKLYPVRIVPHGLELRRVGDRRIETRHFSILGVRKPDRRLWKGSLELWLATDAAATPIAIAVSRRGAGVLLELTPTSLAAPSAGS